MNNNYKKLIDEAENFLRVALREYQKGKAKENEMKIRQGADKAWNASVQATKALAKKMGKRIPRSYNAQLQFLRATEKEHPDIARRYPFLHNAFQSFAKTLHGECFYHGEYSLEELDGDFEDVRRYIDVIEKIDGKVGGGELDF